MVVAELGSLDIFTTMTQNDINQGEWDNTANWSVLTYNSPRDSRLFVPKRRGFGWTVNFGNPNGKIVFGIFLASPVVIVCVALFAAFHFGKR